MMKFLRSQSQVVLGIIIAVVALTLVFYGSAGTNFFNGSGSRGSSDYGSIDGEDLSVAELYDAVHETRNLLVIEGQGQALRQPGVSAEIAQEAWRRLLLLREADKLHITISDAELIDYVRTQPIFQKNGAFDPASYQLWMAQLQSVLRSSADGSADPAASSRLIVENVLRDDLRVRAVSDALLSSIHTAPDDLSGKYEKFYGPATVSFVSFQPSAFAAAAQVTPADIDAEYKAHPDDAAYRTPEKRRVDYVLFMLTPDQAKLAGAEKASAKDALGQKALDFALACQPDPAASGTAAATGPDFMAEAKKRSLNPQTTGYFTADETPAGVPPSPAFNSAAFALGKDDPISKVVDLTDGVAVLHLVEIQPSELRPLPEVQADIVASLQKSKGFAASQAAAQNASRQLRADVAKGMPFAQAAAAMKLKVETLPAFSPMTASRTDARLQALGYAVTRLDAGGVSDAIPMQDESTVVVHLDARAKADTAGFAAFETKFRDSQDDEVRKMVRTDWTDWKSKQAGTHKPPELESYGSID